MPFTIAIVDDFRALMPQTPFVPPLRYRALGGHWTAGGDGPAGSKGSVDFLIARRDRNASYHEQWGWDRSRKRLEVRRTVRAGRAAHSFNPRQPSQGGPWTPNAHARRLMGDLWWNPNVAAYVMSYAGMPADLAADIKDPDFLAACRERLAQLKADPAIGVGLDRLFTHADGQSNKADWGAAFTAALKAAPAPQPVPQEDESMPLTYVPQTWTVIAAKGAPLRERPSLAAPAVATIPKGVALFTVAETDDGNWRHAVNDTGRLLYAWRDDLKEDTPGMRDTELADAIATVVNARIADKPLTAVSGLTDADVNEAVKKATAPLQAKIDRGHAAAEALAEVLA